MVRCVAFNDLRVVCDYAALSRQLRIPSLTSQLAGDIMASDLIGSAVTSAPSFPAPSTSLGPPRTGAGRETSMKLGCGCGPIAPSMRIVKSVAATRSMRSRTWRMARLDPMSGAALRLAGRSRWALFTRDGSGVPRKSVRIRSARRARNLFVDGVLNRLNIYHPQPHSRQDLTDISRFQTSGRCRIRRSLTSQPNGVPPLEGYQPRPKEP